MTETATGRRISNFEWMLKEIQALRDKPDGMKPNSAMMLAYLVQRGLRYQQVDFNPPIEEEYIPQFRQFGLEALEGLAAHKYISANFLKDVDEEISDNEIFSVENRNTRLISMHEDLQKNPDNFGLHNFIEGDNPDDLDWIIESLRTGWEGSGSREYGVAFLLLVFMIARGLRRNKSVPLHIHDVRTIIFGERPRDEDGSTCYNRFEPALRKMVEGRILEIQETPIFTNRDYRDLREIPAWKVTLPTTSAKTDAPETDGNQH